MSNTFTTFKGSKDGSLVKSSTTRPDPVEDQVLIKVTHSGLCGTDLHYQHADMCLGHEGVGIVEKVGPMVKEFKTGDRVGFGYQHASCGSCKYCLNSREPYCPKAGMYGYVDHDIGSLSSGVVWSAKHVYPIPEGVDSADAAPLMCGGATVYSVLADYDVKPDDTVGVIGVGGLGHLAIQFAAKMGCEVVVFSQGESKKDDAFKMGATHYVATAGKDSLEPQMNGKKLDHLIVTTEVQPKWELFLPIINKLGAIYPLTVELGTNLSIPYIHVVVNGLRIQGSCIAGTSTQRNMLAFAARHNIKPVLQKFKFDQEGVDAAFKTLKDGKMRYRGVIEMS